MNKIDTISNYNKPMTDLIKSDLLIGATFGRLKILSPAKPLIRKDGKKRKRYLCLCICGNQTIVLRDNLLRENTTSCGCYHSEKARRSNLIHGYSSKYGEYLDTWQIWKGMLRRCYDPKHKHYFYYGGRGIKVCQRWRESFENFLKDMGKRPDKLTLDRYPNKNGNYEPENCRWATRKEQANNTCNNHMIWNGWQNKLQTVREFCEYYEIPSTSFYRLYKKGVSPEQIMERYKKKKAYRRWDKK